MAILHCDNKSFEVDLVAFDKDGTLIEFGPLWGGLARLCVESLAAKLNRPDLITPLYEALGYDPVQKVAVSGGPLAVTPMEGLDAIAVSVMVEHGFEQQAAEQAVNTSYGPCLRSEPSAEMLVPIGDVAELLANLAEAGVTVAVVTSDDRHPTVSALRTLGWDQWITLTVCADDPLPSKPAPDALYLLRDQTGIPTGRMAMVGDNPGDIRTGLAAGAAATIGVLSGNSGPGDFEGLAHAVIGTVMEIAIE
jgi:phosphoglycolate phosphatase-like HAD superfamily hydrolase